MKYLLGFFFVIIFYSNSYCQDDNLFAISELKITDSVPYISKSFYNKQPTTFFEDDDYIVRSSVPNSLRDVSRPSKLTFILINPCVSIY